MKHLLITLIWLLVFFLAFWIAGCTQVIVEPDRLQINAFLMSTGFDNLYYDPNVLFEVNKYDSIPSDIELVFDPVTRTIKAKTKANKLGE